jgi:hypothetical protein
VKFLDLKSQAPDLGTFKIFHSHRYYQRAVRSLEQRGWAWRENGEVRLRAYQFVWRSMGVERLRFGKRGVKFRYWKIPVDGLSLERKGYLTELESWIRAKVAERKRSQLRHALNKTGQRHATYAAKSVANLFGYRSPDTGSKLRKKYFEVLPMSTEEAKPRFNPVRGRYEEPCKKIAL